jgi:enoyl-CoA hydratase
VFQIHSGCEYLWSYGIEKVLRDRRAYWILEGTKEIAGNDCRQPNGGCVSDLIVRTNGICGRITLNRPRALNAMTLDMVLEMSNALGTWARDAKVEFVLVDGAGDRGLCAGGDVRAIYNYAISGDIRSVESFFREEYRLNYLIARYPKPYISLMDGVVMGGGLGISVHGTHRVVSERSIIAMPEARIGFVPDVGGTYFLANAPGEFGTYLALTSRRIGAGDAILCQLADLFVSGDRLPLLREELVKCGSRSAMHSCLRSFASIPPPSELVLQRDWITACFAAPSVESILETLEARREPEAIAAASEIAKNSPTSLKVTLLALRNGRLYGELGPCLEQEYSIALSCIRDGDFVEGVRAAVIDKDRKPRWKPDRLEEVTPKRVSHFFSKAGSPGSELSDWLI